jgi:hypothetical protein
MLVKIIVLVGLTRMLAVTRKPLLCAGIYTALGLLLGLMFAPGALAPLATLALRAVLQFGLASLYFWLLMRFDRGLLYWVILVVGLVIGLV